ncbi:glycoside hydrolase family 38 C-terminal domain-containing protein [Tepidiforma sp.]|uniref:glycoside hydrolase family 38 N-terminal domain-containing protein n=1 Tax=Tepidiforma sp. TaxID=2682230 RepID=UPI002ADE0782|nr:glycoside hydrolase family 38 C-terminal domain-containing protein [Tepidiforma sp.]
MDRVVYVVPHCHWDREWYQPYELFRWRLVQMIDELLDHMEAHPEYRCFNLDGQSIVIADYLELRPEQEGRLRALIEEGRIVIGPWWVQPDEFLPSGESHIRSFQRGIRFAERMGGCLRVGHCADQFGHIAQMPQLMRQLGLTSACLWRGVPDAVPGWSFWWEAPDGTRVPVLYLRNSYSSGWRLPKDPDELIERTRRQERDLRPGLPALLMNGTDHSRMEPHVPAALAAASGRGYDYRLATLAEYEAAVFAAGIDDVVRRGELRSPDRSNILVGVLSTRVPIKLRDFEVSRALERYAEPLELLGRLHGGPDGLPALRHAWSLALENTPHDSICGCSVDQVHREMFPRYDRAEQLAMQVAREGAAHVIRRMEVPEPGGLAILRPVAGAPATIEANVPAAWAAFDALRLPGGQLVPFALEPREQGLVLQHEEVSPRGVLRHLDFLREQRYDVHAIEAMAWELEGSHLRVTTTVGPDITVVDEDGLREEVRNAVLSGAAETAEVLVRESQRATLRAVLPPAEAVGLELAVPVRLDGAAPPARPPSARRIANEWFEVRLRGHRLDVIDRASGRRYEDVCRFVSEGDRGDEYNADILPDPVAEPAGVTLHGTLATPACQELRYTLAYDLPARLARSRTRRSRRARVLEPISVTVRLWHDLRRVDFHVAVTNLARDHRLRALFPLPGPVTAAITENQFHVAERPLEPPPWNGQSAELPPTTFPQKCFAAFEAGGAGLAVFNRGLQEGEVVTFAGRQWYALTLLRCVGWLSRIDLRSRRGGAGPMIATVDSQLIGTHAFSFALATYEGPWDDAGIHRAAHAFAAPPIGWATNAHEGSLDGQVALLALEGDAVLSVAHRSEETGEPVVRVFAGPTGGPVRLCVPPAADSEALRVDLLERNPEPLPREGEGWFLHLRPWEIASILLRTAGRS